ncbi:hypothetical protein SAMN04488245_10774 [Alloyangia pacifica]|uniref:Uncharacterized protein n=1 Tax=Alloyangia pacifica TaxID=311180 RepID=A0A1I6U1W3_9RHOB|nr:hypothetical protein SAMN04488245_10774 [Alloyangia pacifica]SFS95412.1 hypothetical protein SAMN04488050_10774 [Alloyangia pacifica]
MDLSGLRNRQSVLLRWPAGKSPGNRAFIARGLVRFRHRSLGKDGGKSLTTPVDQTRSKPESLVTIATAAQEQEQQPLSRRSCTIHATTRRRVSGACNFFRNFPEDGVSVAGEHLQGSAPCDSEGREPAAAQAGIAGPPPALCNSRRCRKPGQRALWPGKAGGAVHGGLPMRRPDAILRMAASRLAQHRRVVCQPDGGAEPAQKTLGIAADVGADDHHRRLTRVADLVAEFGPLAGSHALTGARKEDAEPLLRPLRADLVDSGTRPRARRKRKRKTPPSPSGETSGKPLIGRRRGRRLMEKRRRVT